MRTVGKAVFICMVATMLVLSGCSGEVSRDDTFVYLLATDTGSLDPSQGAWNSQYVLLYDVYDRLVTYRGESAEVQPMLAETWEISPDATQWTFHLRKDAKFHDGSPVNAEAVKFSILRILEIGKTGKGLLEPYVSEDGIETPDEHTVVFNLKAPFPALAAILASPLANICNPKVMEHEKDGDWGQGWAATNDIGSGPYILESAKLGEVITLKRNDNYWGPKANFERVIVKIVPEASTQRAMIERGEADMANGYTFSWEILDQMAGAEGVKIVEASSMHTDYLILNGEKSPLDDARVRKAIAHGIDYDGVISGIYQGHASRINGPVPEGLMGYDPALPFVETDLDGAKRLLEEAGYPDGFKAEFSISPEPIVRQAAVKIQSDLAKIGVDLEIRQYAWSAYMDKLCAGDFEIAFMGWTPDYADPHFNIWCYLHSDNVGPGYNWAFYRNPEVDALIEEAIGISDQTRREDLYREIQRITAEDCPYIWLSQNNRAQVMRDDIEGYYMNAMNPWYVPFAEISRSK